MNIVCYGASVTAQKEQAGYFYALKKMYKNKENMNFYQVSFAASVFDQAGFAFMKNLENITKDISVCFIDWLTPGSQKFNIQKVESLSLYLLSLGALPVWVNFPRLDDLDNNRLCYQQVKQHCLEFNIPFIDAYQNSKLKSIPIDKLLRDKVHTTPLGGQLYAEILQDFLENLKSPISLPENYKSKISSSINESYLISEEIDFDIKKAIKINFNSDIDLFFELYFLAEIGPYTPILNLALKNLNTGSTECIEVNCLDIWSHYNRVKCIKILNKKISKGKYELFISTSNVSAVESIDIKKPVDKEKYPNKELSIPIQQISCNVQFEKFTIEEMKHV